MTDRKNRFAGRLALAAAAALLSGLAHAADTIKVGVLHSLSGTMASPGDFFGWNVDALLERKVGDGGAVSLEGAYYDYDHDDKVPAFGYQGTGYYVLASYLTPQKFGIGKLQPHVRYQAVSDDNGPDHDRWEVGLGYIIDGQKAKVIATYGADDYDGSSSTDFFILGVQLQI